LSQRCRKTDQKQAVRGTVQKRRPDPVEAIDFQHLWDFTQAPGSREIPCLSPRSSAVNFHFVFRMATTLAQKD